MNDVAFLDATAQAELVRTKQISPLELVEGAIERIERLNPKLNAVVTPMFEEARRVAASPPPEGPFTGVPFLLKDSGAAYAGVRQTRGSRALKDNVSPIDFELTRRHKAAGLVICGKANLPEFGLIPTTEPVLFGATRNPWDTGRSTGGSSGGSAAAVAAGMVPMAHGTDGGGSIRIPASCCGVFGLKPTRGRITMGPVLGDALNGLINEHGLTRSVRDSAALLDATAGPMPGDPYTTQAPERPFSEEIGRSPGRLRIAFTTRTQNDTPLHDDCIAAVKDAAALCEELGHHVEEAEPDINSQQLQDAFSSVWFAGCAASIEGLRLAMGTDPREEDFEPMTWAMAEAGRNVSGAQYLLSIAALQTAARKAGAFHETYDLSLTATLAEPPLPLGSFNPSPSDPLAGFKRAVQFVPYTAIQNATGQPAMSVPLYWNAGGLPVGVHFAARYGDEAMLFRLAAQLEEARPWTGRIPPVSA
jgi:amidase